MHVLFVHQNFPAQFGHVARHLVREHGFRCTFVSKLPAAVVDGVRRIPYKPRGGATAQTPYLTRTFENYVANSLGVLEACRAHPGLAPDLVVGHSGFGSTLFLREAFDCPILNYFELFYHPHDADFSFRPEFPIADKDVLRGYCRNGPLLLDLEACRAGYSPTRWQRDTLPDAYRPKVEVIFDGVDPEVWHRREGGPRQVAGRTIPPGTRIVTYAARGFEATRGFDIFLKAARRIYRARPDVLFVVVGEDRVVYGGDAKHIGGSSFRDYAMAQDDYDASKFLFTGAVPPEELARILSLGDAHIYLTVPFVLSWSLFNAMACGCTVVASDTGPVLELIEHGRNGLLAGFYDVKGLADLALRVLDDPPAHRHLGRAAEALIAERYTMAVTLPKMLDLYRRTVEGVGRGADADADADAGPGPGSAPDFAAPPRPRPRPRRYPGPRHGLRTDISPLASARAPRR